MSRFTQYLTVSAAVILAGSMLAGTVDPTPAPSPVATSTPAPDPSVPPVQPPTVTFGSEGDSISALVDNLGRPLTWSWVHDALVQGDLTRPGGYMRAGAISAELVWHGVPIPAKVVVIMIGTNDVSTGVPLSSTLNNIAAAFAKTGGAVKVLSAVAPRNIFTKQTNNLNYWLRQLAKQHHWVFVDPWATVRMGPGTWKPGANSDTTHPSPATGAMVGAILRSQILAYAG